MSEIYKILSSLEHEPSRNAKIDILTENKTCAVLQQVFVAALDPYVTYHIKKIPSYTPNVTTMCLDLATAIEELKQLSDRIVTGHTGIDFLTTLLEKVSPEDAIIIGRIIKGDLRCGVQESTINKVWQKLIPTYPCLLAKPYDEKSIKAIHFPAFSQLKADGMRANLLCDGKSFTIRGRSGKIVDLLGKLDDDAAELYRFYNKPCVFDGELIVVEKDGTVMDRKKGNGILNKAIRGKISSEEAGRVRLRVWDLIPLGDFREYVCNNPYESRFKELTAVVDAYLKSEFQMFSQIIEPGRKISLIEHRVVNSIAEAQAHFEDAISRKEEGTMLKNFHGIWEDKRSKHLVKLKSEKDCDLEVIGWNPGTIGTKLEGKLGSLICASADRLVEVSISGFTDELRQEIFDNIDDWVGRIVTVMYNERISSKHINRATVDSLFLPRFVEERLDKTVADNSAKIK